MKKIWIVGLIIFSLFITSMSSVIAADETEIITDDEDDVFDFFSSYDGEISYVSTVPNIDVISVTYEKGDGQATLTLTVKGEIENKGDIDESWDAETLETIEYISYTSSLSMTNGAYYTVSYVNAKCQLSYADSLDALPEIENISSEDFTVEGANLTIFFTLRDAENSFDTLEVLTEYVRYSLNEEEYEEVYYIDIVPNEMLDGDTGNGGDGDEDDTGDNNNSGGTDNTTFLFFIAIIAAICIIGVAVLIFVIRR